MSDASRDGNYVTTLLAVSSVDGITPVTLYANPTTHRLLVDLAGGGSGTVQTVAIATANGFAGTSDANPSAPTLTITTSITGVLYGNGTAISALTIGAGLDLTGSTLSATGGGSGTVTSVGFTGGLISVATPTTTPAFTVAGTSGGVPYFSSASTWASSALLAANAIVVGGGAGVAPSTVTTGTGVLTALGVNVGSAGAFVTFNGALGTPSSGTVTNLTGTASININGTVGATTPTTATFTTATINTSIVPDANDGAVLGSGTVSWADLFLATGGVINWNNGEITLTQAGNELTVAGTAATFVAPTIVANTAFIPDANDGATLGTSGSQFSDLFLAEGGVINWDNGDATITQSGNTVTLAGASLSARSVSRTASSTTSSNLSPDLATADIYFRTTQTATLTIDAPTNAVIGDTIMIYVDSAGAQTLTINATYVAFGAAFPATTTAGKTFMMSAQFNGTNWKTLWANAI